MIEMLTIRCYSTYKTFFFNFKLYFNILENINENYIKDTFSVVNHIIQK